MNKSTLSLTLLFMLAVITTSSAQYIKVDDTYTAQQLVENVLVNNQCASVSNITVSGGNFSSGAQSYGYFNGNNSGFPFTEGVILSTGRAIKAVGPNTSLLDDGGGNMDWGGDLDLMEALNISNSVNATVLEFDFVPLADNISFTYMLSSEEYHDDAPCRYSDGFAFLLKEANNPASTYTNLAVIPDSTIPVKVTSVHPRIDGPNGCIEQNEQYFDAFNGTQHPTNFNGQTKVMTATSKVVPGTVYHIKLVIADEGNYRYDSAIFLGGGSFASTVALGPDRLFATNNPLCHGEAHLLNGTALGATGYQWYKDGVAIAGETNATYTATSSGVYKVAVHFTPTCDADGEITLEYSPALNFGIYTLLQCDDNNDGLTAYNLQQAGDVAISGDTSLQAVGYFTDLAAAQNNTNPLNASVPFYNTTAGQQIYVRIQNQFGCHGVATVTLATSNNTITAPTPLETCDTDGNEDGIFSFDLTPLNSTILNGLPAGVAISYYPTQQDALMSANVITAPQSFTNTVAYNQTIYARLSQGADCYGTVPVRLVVHGFGRAVNDEELIQCAGVPLVLNPGNGYTSYTWNTTPAQNTQTITVNSGGTYTVTLTNTYNCSAQKTYYVTESGAVTDIKFDINDFKGGNNSVSVIAEGIGSYVYSIDGFNWQDSNTFYNLESGEYSFYTKDMNGCGVALKSVYVLDYPKFFTPNGDNTNDTWYIRHLGNRPGVRVKIFDRYGKLITGFSGNSQGWDGALNGLPLPATDYWFTITLENGRIVKGHFSLIR